MIVYSGTKDSFINAVTSGVIASEIKNNFSDFGILGGGYSEFKSWEASLPKIALVMSDRRIDDDVQVALEYQIPLTSKRVDFMVGGSDESGNKDNVVIVELKQWTDCETTSLENVVKAFTGGSIREVTHPSQQAYSYAKLIENFNEDVRHYDIGLKPCAYLHNFEEKNRIHIDNVFYSEAISDAPVFLQKDNKKLADYISKYVSKPSKKKLFNIIENGKIKPSKALQDTIGSILNGNKEFEMIDEQQVAYSTVLKLVEETIDKDEKHTIIIQGGPGTGKSVIAINLLAKIINNNHSCVYVTKTTAPRYTFANNLTKGVHKISFLKGLFIGAGGVYKIKNNTYECMLCDEAHRLAKRSGLFSKGNNQIREIINASKISVFFIDEDQIVTTKDIGTIDEIKKCAKEIGSTVHYGKSLELVSQFRCNGSDGYIAFLDDLLQIRQTANKTISNLSYDFRVFDNPYEMREALRKLNGNNKARMIAGYCYDWVSKDDKDKMDIIFSDGFEAQWNFNTESFASDINSFEQIGCIHSTQGLEFDYAGIIIGKDLICRNNIIKTNPKAVAKTDHSSGIRTAPNAIADRLIRNTYKVMMTRGQKGCFVFCEDNELREYINKRLNISAND